VHLIRLSQQGDEQAFAALFEQYKNLVYKTALLMLDDRQDAEEALQDVFVLVYRSLAGFDEKKGAFTTWLHRVTINHCLNHRRKKGVAYDPLDEVTLSETADDPETTWDALVEKDRVEQAIAKLSEKQRTVVILRYYWELPYAEIAQILNVPLGTIKSRLDRSLRTLRQILDEQDKTACARPLSEEEIEL
jgi:RNA polymerase sigma-70 factor (ECF subfamily)